MRGLLTGNNFLYGFKEVANKLTFNNRVAQRKRIKHGKMSRNLSVILADLTQLIKLQRTERWKKQSLSCLDLLCGEFWVSGLHQKRAGIKYTFRSNKHSSVFGEGSLNLIKIASFQEIDIFVKCLKKIVTEFYINFETILFCTCVNRSYLYFCILQYLKHFLSR